MRKSFSTLLLVVMCATASAAPADDQKSSDPSDEVHVTVTAGRGRLGIAVIQMSPELRAFFGAPNDRGVLVDSVRADNPAARAGIRVGDIVTDVGGVIVRSASDILDALDDHKQGEQVPIAVLRGGKRMQLMAMLDTDPGPRWRALEQGFPKGFKWRWRDDELDNARKHLEELERLFDKLERT